jgi:hypothetical protein
MHSFHTKLEQAHETHSRRLGGKKAEKPQVQLWFVQDGMPPS